MYQHPMYAHYPQHAGQGLQYGMMPGYPGPHGPAQAAGAAFITP